MQNNKKDCLDIEETLKNIQKAGKKQLYIKHHKRGIKYLKERKNKKDEIWKFETIKRKIY